MKALFVKLRIIHECEDVTVAYEGIALHCALVAVIGLMMAAAVYLPKGTCP